MVKAKLSGLLLLNLVPIILTRPWRSVTSELMTVEVPGPGDAKASQGQPRALRPLACMNRVSVPRKNTRGKRYQSVNSVADKFSESHKGKIFPALISCLSEFFIPFAFNLGLFFEQ